MADAQTAANTAAQRDGAVQFGAVELGNQTMNRLAAYLETL